MEFFVIANSFAAPFLSDQSSEFVEADTPEDALVRHADNYKHPAGLYSAVCYANADAFHKGRQPLARWLCNHAKEQSRITENMSGYSYLGHGPGNFEINGKHYTVEHPKDGGVVR